MHFRTVNMICINTIFKSKSLVTPLYINIRIFSKLELIISTFENEIQIRLVFSVLLHIYNFYLLSQCEIFRQKDSCQKLVLPKQGVISLFFLIISVWLNTQTK